MGLAFLIFQALGMHFHELNSLYDLVYFTCLLSTFSLPMACSSLPTVPLGFGALMQDTCLQHLKTQGVFHD